MPMLSFCVNSTTWHHRLLNTLPSTVSPEHSTALHLSACDLPLFKLVWLLLYYRPHSSFETPQHFVTMVTWCYQCSWPLLFQVTCLLLFMCFCVIVAYGPDSSTSINLVYVPSHLYYILFELFKVLSLIYYLLCMYVTCLLYMWWYWLLCYFLFSWTAYKINII